MIRTSNPVMNDSTFDQYSSVPSVPSVGSTTQMTVAGTINKTAVLLFLSFITASLVWSQFYAGSQNVNIWMMVGIFGGLILGLITSFKAKWSPFTAPAYALFEGLALGGISAVLELQFPGIVIQAVGLTLGITASMLLIYRSGLIKVTDKFRMIIGAAMGGIFLVYMASWIMGFFGKNIGFIHSSGPIGIGFSVVVIAIVSLSLLTDFDMIEKGAHRGAPKFMEWYGAFAVMVTLVWLYLEILRLLAKLQRRR